MSNQPTSASTPNTITAAPGEIIARVLNTKDADVPLQSYVVVTGFTARVPRVMRQQAIGAPKEVKDAVVSFGFNDLEFDHKGAAFVLAAVDEQITAILDTVTPRAQAGKTLSLVERVKLLANQYDAALAETASMEREAGRKSHTEKVTEGTPLKYIAITPPLYTHRKVAEAAYNSFVACGINNYGIEDFEAWMKNNGVAIDRDNKPVESETERPVSRVLVYERSKLPDTRPGLNHKFDVGGQKGYINVGYYPDGRVGEVFIVVQRQGSTLQGFADAWARSLSMLLQYGVPLPEIVRMFVWNKFEPRGITPNQQIKYANSIVDYVARWLGYTHIKDYAPGGEPVAEVTDVATENLHLTAP